MKMQTWSIVLAAIFGASVPQIFIWGAWQQNVRLGFLFSAIVLVVLFARILLAPFLTMEIEREARYGLSK